MFRRHTDEQVRIVQQILGKFPDLVDANRQRPEADPFVIALAYDESHQKLLGQECVVVTEERYRPGRPRIPHVCEALKLQYQDIHQMFLAEGWAF